MIRTRKKTKGGGVEGVVVLNVNKTRIPGKEVGIFLVHCISSNICVINIGTSL